VPSRPTGQIGVSLMTYLSPEDPPEGAVRQHTLYGEPANHTGQAHTMTVQGVEVIPVSGDYPYTGPGDEPVPFPEETEETVDRSRRCMANDDTCNGWRIKDSVYCYGHTRKQ
jgi:hypothetical protein